MPVGRFSPLFPVDNLGQPFSPPFRRAIRKSTGVAEIRNISNGCISFSFAILHDGSQHFSATEPLLLLLLVTPVLVLSFDLMCQYKYSLMPQRLPGTEYVTLSNSVDSTYFKIIFCDLLFNTEFYMDFLDSFKAALRYFWPPGGP